METSEAKVNCDFKQQVSSIFNQIRNLINSLEEKIKDREEELKAEAKEALLTQLETIYEDISNQQLESKAKRQRKEKHSLFSCLRAKFDGKSLPAKGWVAQSSSSLHLEGREPSPPPAPSLPPADEVNFMFRALAKYTRKLVEEPNHVPNAGHSYESCSSSEAVDTMVIPVNPEAILEPDIVPKIEPEIILSYDIEDEEEGHLLDASQENEEEMLMVKREPRRLEGEGRPLSKVRVRDRRNVQNMGLQSSLKNQCPLCCHTFSQRNSLLRHLRSHTGEKPFPCPICGKCFIDKERLKVHNRIHTGEKPFSCNVCGRQFSQKSTVKRHLSVHSGLKPYACSHCGKAFGSKDNLKVHLKCHSRWMQMPDTSAISPSSQSSSTGTESTSRVRPSHGYRKSVIDMNANR